MMEGRFNLPIAITQPGPGAQRVFGMALSRVLLPGYRCDAPLRPPNRIPTPHSR